MNERLLMIALLSLTACNDDDWTFRPRDSGEVVDAQSGDATSPLDVPSLTDSGVPADQPPTDAPPGSDAVVLSDVSSPSDAIAPDGSVSDGSTTGLSLRASGFTTTGSEPQTVGTLRLTETGFESGERVCVGSLCVVGGFLP